jgi:ribosomal protein S18 acetylase RimI-like enzyme
MAIGDSDELVCRPAGPEDEGAVAGMMRAFYGEERLAYSDACAAALRALLADAALGAVFVVHLAAGLEQTRSEQAGPGRAIGYFVLTWGFSLERGGKMALLDELYVVPEARGRGAGRAAIGAATDAARAAGCGAIVLEVDQANVRAREFYRRAGFAVLGRDCLGMTVDGGAQKKPPGGAGG